MSTLKIIAWLAFALVLLVRLPVFLALVIAPGPGTAGSAVGAVIAAAIVRFVILKVGAYFAS